jgi:hypothetical protein
MLLPQQGRLIQHALHASTKGRGAQKGAFGHPIFLHTEAGNFKPFINFLVSAT